MDRKVIIAGAGTMGASLAQVYAQADWDTVLYTYIDLAKVLYFRDDGDEKRD